MRYQTALSRKHSTQPSSTSAQWYRPPLTSATSQHVSRQLPQSYYGNRKSQTTQNPTLTGPSQLGKIIESVLTDLLSYLTETHNLLPANHFGGRPGRTGEDAMAILSEKIHMAWKERDTYS